MGSFTGFGKQALPFFKGIAFHQNKAWFDENRAIYDRDFVEPMIALLDDLTERFAKARIPLKADGKRSMFRLNRDIRFSKDKSPYKTHGGAVMTRSGDKNDNGLLYIHIDPEGCFTAAGFYMPEPGDLAKLRKAVTASSGKKYRAVESALRKGELELGHFDQLTRVPKGFEKLKDGPLDGAIRLKSFIVEEKLPQKLIGTSRMTDAIFDFAKRSMPLLKFGWTALE
jgi:uncharacterized protein (TIGR02453 family)